jgi:hypothetical protein
MTAERSKTEKKLINPIENRLDPTETLSAVVAVASSSKLTLHRQSLQGHSGINRFIPVSKT